MTELPPYDRYTPVARQAIKRAEDEAGSHGHVTAGHLLLGLLASDDNLAVQVLNRLGISVDVTAARRAFLEILGYQDRPAAG